MERDNIVLIGMPGAGKSTVGVVLAKRRGLRFLDSDLVIQDTYGKLLHELIEENGAEGFWELEGTVNAGLEVHRCVIATGGSAVYHAGAMEHLCAIGTVVYLKLSCEEIEKRLGDLNARGVTIRKGQTLQELYAERTPLYERYANMTVECDNLSLWEIVEHISDRMRTN